MFETFTSPLYKYSKIQHFCLNDNYIKMFYIRETKYIYNACESWANICFGIALIIKALKKDHCWRYRDQDACGILKATSKESKRARRPWHRSRAKLPSGASRLWACLPSWWLENNRNVCKQAQIILLPNKS